jgi:hypothetical protein
MSNFLRNIVGGTYPPELLAHSERIKEEEKFILAKLLLMEVK